MLEGKVMKRLKYYRFKYGIGRLGRLAKSLGLKWKRNITAWIK